jgi:PAS domain S-box-containing protein
MEPVLSEKTTNEAKRMAEELATHASLQNDNVEALANSFVERAASALDGGFASVWEVVAPDQSLHNIARCSALHPNPALLANLPRREAQAYLTTLAAASSIVSTDTTTDPRLDPIRSLYVDQLGIVSLVHVAILESGKIAGFVAFEQTSTRRPWLPAELTLASTGADLLSLAAANRRDNAVEPAIQMSDSMMRAVAAHLRGAIYQRPVNIDAAFTYISSGIEPIAGRNCRDIMVGGSKTLADIIHPDDLEKVRSTIDDAVRSGTAFDVEYRLQRPDGEGYWIADRGNKVVGADGLPRIDGVIHGAEKRKRSEEAARGLSALRAAILENAAYAVIATDTSGIITFFNRAAENMLGYAGGELIGRATPAIFFDPVEVEARAIALSEELGRDISAGFGAIVARTQAGQPNEVEWTCIHRQGAKVQVLLSVTAMRNAANEVSGYLCVAADLTERNRIALRLRQSEDVLSRILLQSPDAIIITTLDTGRILECNPGFEHLTDNSRADSVGRTSSQLNMWEDLADRDSILSELQKTGEVRSFSFQLKRRGGDVRDCVLWARTFVFDETPAILSVIHDVTDIRSSERAARQSQEMLQTVLDAMPSLVFWKDRNSVYLGCNRLFATDNGLSDPHEIIGKTDYDIAVVGPEASDNTAAYIAADRQVIESKSIWREDRVPYVAANGQLRWASVTKAPIFGPDGEVAAVLGVQHDVTMAFEAQERLRVSEEKLRSLFEFSPLGITLVTLDGRYVEVNDAFLTLTGYERPEIIGANYYSLTAPGSEASHRDHFERLLASGRYGPYETDLVRKDGAHVPVSLNGAVVTGPDGASYVWATIENISARKAIEEAERQMSANLERLVIDRTAELKVAMETLMRSEKLASLGSLVAGIAHEISTPVGNANLATSTMMGAIEDFERQLAGDLSRAALDHFVKQVRLGFDIANRNIERVANLIQDFKQVAIDQTSSQRRNFRLIEVAQEIVTTMHPSLKRSAVTAEILIPPDLELDSYPGPLGQVLANLINNAVVHAFPSDGTTMDTRRVIRIGAEAVDSERMRLDIGDNGVGIAASALGRIFDPFYTSKLGKGGSGLGLHIVHNIVADILAGSVTVTSKQGKGTTFSIFMPRVTPVWTNGARQALSL